MNHRDLTKGSVGGHLRRLAIPASIGFFFNTMYNVVDTFYAGLVSTEALAAMSISFPVFFIIIALSSGISTGCSALISNALGGNLQKHAKRLASQSFSFAIMISLVLMIAGFFSAPALFRILGADGNYLHLALSYINVIIFGVFFFLILHVLNSMLVAQGDTKTLRNVLILGFLLNLILDPWFLYGGFGVPAMGLKGIALATVLIMGLNSVILFVKVLRTGMLDFSNLTDYIPRKKYMWMIIQQGLPASLNMMSVAIGIFVITYFLSSFGSGAVAAYGISTRIEQIVLIPLIGLNMSTLAIVGQNNGAKEYLRIKKALGKALLYGLVVTGISAVLMFFFAPQLMRFFTDDIIVIDIGITALRVAAFISLTYILLYINISALQGMKKPMYALYIGLFRQIIAPIAVFYLFVNIMGFGILSIWFGILGINWIAAMITVIYTRHVLKKMVERN